MDKIYQSIVNSIVRVLPQQWDKLIVYSQITDESYEIFFYVRKDGTMFSDSDLEKEFGISRKEIRESFKEIYNLLLPDQKKRKWFCQTFILNCDGLFKVEYDYEDHSTDTFSYKKYWKGKYMSTM